MRSTGFWMLSVLSLTGVWRATSQDLAPPAFAPYTGPTIAFPGAGIVFSVIAHSFQTNGIEPSIQYDLLAAPTNVFLSTTMGRPPDELFACLSWNAAPRAAVGTTNVFVIRATDQGTPPLSSTLTQSFVLVDPPPIRTIFISNAAPALQFTDPLVGQPFGVPSHYYRFLWSEDLTSWSLLCMVWPASPLVTVTDTNGFMLQRFYKLEPYGAWTYGFCGP